MASKQTELRHIGAALSRWDTRLRVQQNITWLPRGLLVGFALALIMASAARMWPLFTQLELIRNSALLALAGIAAVSIGVWVWRRSPLQIARRFDRTFGLKERLSTAVEVAEGGLPIQSDRLAAAQRADAAAVLARVDEKDVFAARVEMRDMLLVLIVLTLLILAIYLPNPQEEVRAEQVAAEEVIAEQLEALEELREEALEDTGLTEEEQVAIVETLDEAIESLSQEGLTEEEALAELNETQQELEDMSEQFAEERQEALEEASGLLEDTPGMDEVAGALAEGDMAEAAEALENALEGMSPEEMAEFAEQLESLAESLEGTNPDLAESLQDAAEALQSGDVGAAQEALEDAAAQMEGAGAAGEYAGKVPKGESGQGESPSQPGEGGMGEAQPIEPGAGQSGSGQQPGEGSGGEGQGGGDGLDPGQEAGEEPRGGGAPDGGEEPFDDIYAPQRIGGEGGEQVDIPIDPETGLPIAEGEMVDNPTGEATVPYNEVWGDYSGAVNEALESGYIPLGMRDIVQGYFSRLDPEPEQ
ncbi:MAG: hypothetical protein JXJ17_16600 [Anaerolineae bacterium]|nr:hypothetical protein [Anaerolineae bacterium]